MKPIAARRRRGGGQRFNEDTLALMRAAGLARTAAADVTPSPLAEPMAPHVAAAREKRRIDLEPIRAAFLRAGAAAIHGGRGRRAVHVPLGDDVDSVDLARMLNCLSCWWSACGSVASITRC
jgi:dethiobiotin synthetase